MILDIPGKGHLTRDDLMNVEGLKYNPLGPRIVEAFVNNGSSATADENDDTDGAINFRQFARVLSRFQPVSHKNAQGPNSREEKLKCENGLEPSTIIIRGSKHPEDML